MITRVLPGFASIIILVSCSKTTENSFPAFTPVPYQDVVITSGFWKAKIDSNQQNGIPSCFNSCDYSLVNFDIAAGVSDAKREGTEATDSDVYKVIQGAAHALDHHPDPPLEQFVDSLIDRIGAAQWEDGYLNTYWTINDPSKRWTRIETRHELYCAGHLFEAAAAYYEVTGKRKLLDIAIRMADHIDLVFGPGKLENVSGHEEIELALIRLYEVTDEERYLKLAEFFLEERGNPERLAYRASLGDNDPNFGTPERFLIPEYRQDHLPVIDQRKATGHAVRAAYLYSGMADYARVSGSQEYMPALNAIWEDIVLKKIYVTGAIGTAQFHDEGFGSDYNLPNESAYCETCSAIALMLWNYRMEQLTGDSKFADLFELTLYNGGISGGSARGDRFFYTNPLEGNEGNNRHPWYEPGCCPSNFVRFIPQIDQYIYGQNDDKIYVNQFIGSTASLNINGSKIELEQETNYPWEDKVAITIQSDKPVKANILIRIPGWARGNFFPGGLYKYHTHTHTDTHTQLGNTGGYTEKREQLTVNGEQGFKVKVNGKKVKSNFNEKGYLSLQRKWKNGDLIQIELDMEPRLVEGRPEIKDVEGQQVLTRGPVIYCLEGIDNSVILENPGLYKYTTQELNIQANNELTYGINTISGEMSKIENHQLIKFTAIPYFSWRNRGATKMRVWF